MVSTYTALNIKVKFKTGEVSQVDAHLNSKSCNNTVVVEKSELVIIYANCKKTNGD